MKSVVVVGGGVAGIAASVALSEEGYRVRLIEKRPLLGGRASSWIDPDSGDRVDVCQHGTMRCCVNLARLLDLLGTHGLIRYHDTLHFLDSDGRRSVIRGSALPAPFSTCISFLRFRSLGTRDKLGIARAMSAMLLARPGPEWDNEDIGAWFRRHRQTSRSVDRFWAPILISACNESLNRISVSHAFKVFRDGFLASSAAFHFGIPKVPLATLYTEPGIAFIRSRGGCVETRTKVDRLSMSGGKIEAAILRDGERIEADYFVSALQCDHLLKVLPEEAIRGVDYFENLRKIDVSPIVGVHFWFDRHIDCPDALAILDRRSDWIFNKNRNFEQTDEGSYLSVVISADLELTSLPIETIEQLVLSEVREALPEARLARLVRSRVLKERKATFSPKPGVDALRPDQRSPVPNLFVAGEWTKTGWPSTMESAAKSGFLAAERLLEADGVPKKLAAADLPCDGLSRWLLRR